MKIRWRDKDERCAALVVIPICLVVLFLLGVLVGLEVDIRRNSSDILSKGVVKLIGVEYSCKQLTL